MDVYEAIYTTRAMRRMKPDPVPPELLPKLFDAAVRGPSGGNTQLFRFLTVTDPDMKQQIQQIYRECLDELNATQYAAVQDTIETGNAADPAVAQSMRINNSAQWFADNLHHAPMLIFVFGKPGGETTTFPCLWNFCLAARAEGLGTAITTLLKLQKDRVERLLGLPEDEPLYNMHGMIPLGYPTGNWGVANRKPAHESVFSETWGTPVDWRADEPLWP
jgi:nitroreductase